MSLFVSERDEEIDIASWPILATGNEPYTTASRTLGRARSSEATSFVCHSTAARTASS
jgi:hypothetical protein